MPINKPSALSTWATEAVDIVEPSLGKKAQGWLSGERMTAGMLNWVFRNFAEWIRWLFAGSARTLPWQNSTIIDGGGESTEGEHRAIAVLQSTTVAGVMVLLEHPVDGWKLRTCNPLTGAWSDTEIAGGGNTVDLFNGLAANEEKFVIVGQAGRIQTYENGEWTVRPAAGGFTGDFHDVVWDGTQFIAIGGNFEVQTSPNGLSWAQRVNTAPAGGPSPMVSFSAIAAGGSRLVRGGVDAAGHAALWYSDDGGTTWVWAYTSALSVGVTKIIGTLALDGTPIFAAQITNNVSVFGLVGSSGGVEWSTVELTLTEVWGLTCAYNDLLVASHGLHVSPDGVNWHTLPFSESSSLISNAAVSPQGWGLLSRGIGASNVAARTPIQRWF